MAGEMLDRTAPRYGYVLDDDPQVGTIVCRVLESVGFVSRQFVNPDPFLTEIKSIPPNLTVLDLALGQSDAVEVIRQLEVLGYRGELLLISGRDESLLVKITAIGKSRGLAMLPPLQKPFRANDLKRSLGATAEKSHASTEAVNSPAPFSVDLAEALRNRWLELWYQPKIDLSTLKVCGADALVRARHPKHGLVSPARLLPPPGDALYRPLTHFVIQQAALDWAYFAARKAPIKLAVNVPLSAIRASDFIAALRESLPKDSRFPGLILEVTEDEVTREPERIQEIAAQLRLYDVSISIDDFGSGYSSLSRLRDVPFAEIKLDRSFVSNCSFDVIKKSLCVGAINLARGFGATVCAEGVENIQDFRILAEMQCDMAQGFLFAKPMTSELFAKMISAPSATINSWLFESAPAATARLALTA
jgi:EAL domain-containing protein (putative c-di-GMP-specific phosphodiesterase class I)/ActR/RegA family two-component response regulator